MPYSLVYAAHNSHANSSASTSWLTESQCSYPSATQPTRTCAPWGTYKTQQDATCFGWYDETTQEVLRHAHLVLIWEMVCNIGWPSNGSTVWKQPIREAISEANIKFQASKSSFMPMILHSQGADLQSTKGIKQLVHNNFSCTVGTGWPMHPSFSEVSQLSILKQPLQPRHTHKNDWRLLMYLYSPMLINTATGRKLKWHALLIH